MTLQQLKYVIEIARCGSINEAAKHLFISQPSLSSAVKELEEKLNIHIFYRSNTGVKLSSEGVKFLGYAKQVLEQAELLENRYLGSERKFEQFSISSQHYAFVVDAFVQLLKNNSIEEYEFNLRETKTYKIIEDVKNLYSEIGILYLNKLNKRVINKILKDSKLDFHLLFKVKPHIFISSKHPLADKSLVTLKDLDPYPYLSFEQGEHNSLHFSEELMNMEDHRKNIRVTDRATLFNLLIGVNGYTISTGCINTDLNGGKGIISVPIETEETIEIGWICNKYIKLNKLTEQYLDILQRIIKHNNW